MKFSAEAIQQLSQSTFASAQRIVQPKASAAKPPPSQLVTSNWFAIQTPTLRSSIARSTDIAGFVSFTAPNQVASISCITNLTDNDAERFLGCQRSDDVTNTNIALVPVTSITGCVAVPMYKEDCTSLKIQYDPHDLSQAYGSRRRFQWPEGTTMDDHFPDRGSKTVVLAFLPNVFAFAFDSSPPTGSFIDVKDDIAQLEQELPLDPVIKAIELLQANNMNSYAKAVGTGETTPGTFFPDLNDNVVRGIQGLQTILPKMDLQLAYLDPSSRNGKVLAAKVHLTGCQSIARHLNDTQTSPTTST